MTSKAVTILRYLHAQNVLKIDNHLFIYLFIYLFGNKFDKKQQQQSVLALGSNLQMLCCPAKIPGDLPKNKLYCAHHANFTGSTGRKYQQRSQAFCDQFADELGVNMDLSCLRSILLDCTLRIAIFILQPFLSYRHKVTWISRK